MQLPAIIKTKTQKPSHVEDWVDHDKVNSLIARSEAALAETDSSARLIALHAVVDELYTTSGLGKAKGRFDERYGEILDAAVRARLSAESSKIAVTGAGIAISSTVALAIAGSVLPVPPLYLVLGFGLSVVPVGSLVGGCILAEYLPSRQLAPLDGVLKKLAGIHGRVQESISGIENSLTLQEARLSPHLDAMLDVSPSLRHRFAEEAQRAAIKGVDIVAAPAIAPPQKMSPAVVRSVKAQGQG